jgi:DNA invertase Pin-like site-specific DNA recombinase
MSTEYQQYSASNQQARIREFAAAEGYTVVRTYSDEGKSGLRLKGRPGLQSLLSEVMNGTEEFEAILVYDVSRWGRFQDLDEGAHYEFICRSAGKQVIYCAEVFEGVDSPYASIVKGLRRVMAGEYSRELSEKTFAGQCRLVREGYKVGGAAGLGLRRLLLNPNGTPKAILDYRQRKAMQDEHVVLVLGPDDEIETVREIFHWFVVDGLLYAEIARRLNRAGIFPPPHLKKWTKYVIRRMLSDEKYMGQIVYNKTTGRLSSVRKKNPDAQWVRCANVIEPIVSPALFEAARIRAKSDLVRVDPIRAGTRLKALFEKRGRLSVSLMRAEGLHDPSVYSNRFGSLLDAFHWAGYDAKVDYKRISTQAWACRSRRQQIIQRLRKRLAESGHSSALEGQYVLILLGHWRLAIMLFRHARKGWRFDQAKEVDATLCIRPAPNGFDDEYFLVAKAQMRRASVWVGESNFESHFGPFRLVEEQLPWALIELARSFNKECRH